MPKNIMNVVLWQDEAKQFLFKQQQILIWCLIVLFSGLGLGFLFVGDIITNSLEALALFVALVSCSIGLYFLNRFSYDAAAWSVSLVSFVLVGYLILSGNFQNAAMLIAIPVGITTLMVDTKIGLGAAFFSSLAIIALNWISPQSISNHMGITVILVWIAYGFIYLSLRPMYDSVEWAWRSYNNSREIVEESRGYQSQLNASLEEMGRLNEQLVRINQLAQDLRQIAEEERQTKNQFVANVSHELRTPLNMIIGFSEMILEAPELYGENIPAALLADLATIQRNSQHLSSLVDDVLDLSQIEAQEMALTKEWVSPVEIVESAIATVHPLYQSKQLFLRSKIDHDLPMIFCDRTRMREVLINLLSNAGRFTESGGVIVALEKWNNEIRFSVEDSGPGISKENLSRLFEPFHQLDGSIRRQYGGSGLGLSISKRFVEMHEGKMWVESEFERGSTFFFSLPSAESSAKNSVLRWLNPEWEFQKRTHRRLVEPPLIQPRYVVWDEFDIFSKMLNQYMENVELVPVKTVEEVLLALKTEPAQALLINQAVDYHLESLLNNLKELPYTLPVISCELTSPQTLIESFGVEGYLVKPVLREELESQLNRICPDLKTVLIVDDEADARRLYHRMLAFRDTRCRVLMAANGIQALELMRSEQPDCVLLDLTMPEMGGEEMLLIKKSDPAITAIPVIITSAHDLENQVVISQSFTVTKDHGFSPREVISSIEALSHVLAPVHWSADPKGLKAADG